jgi:hypothetical protein
MRCHSVACNTLRQTQITSAIEHAKFRSPSHDAVIRVYDDAGSAIEMHEHAGEFTEPQSVDRRRDVRQ